MSDSEIRTAIAELLRDAGIFYLRDENVERDFIDGSFDATLDQLRFDSLAAMELCIALEANWGSALVPEDLNRIGSLRNLVRIVKEGAS
ncbi:MAG TPA: phosphopantetheine-binding protein [Dongiaceae bacterium]|jgi:acyl carrier protein|nr:phosphopantetheine-binding protein [Dongiaceae bacterium]